MDQMQLGDTDGVCITIIHSIHIELAPFNRRHDLGSSDAVCPFQISVDRPRLSLKPGQFSYQLGLVVRPLRTGHDCGRPRRMSRKVSATVMAAATSSTITSHHGTTAHGSRSMRRGADDRRMRGARMAAARRCLGGLVGRPAMASRSQLGRPRGRPVPGRVATMQPPAPRILGNLDARGTKYSRAGGHKVRLRPLRDRLARRTRRLQRRKARSGMRHVLNVATDAELGFVPNGQMVAVHAERSPESTVDLESALMNAAEESARFLPFAENSNVGELTVCVADRPEPRPQGVPVDRGRHRSTERSLTVMSLPCSITPCNSAIWLAKG